MRLDYDALISNSPIQLSMGRLRKPKLGEIDKLTFLIFGFYESLTRLTPKQYFTVFHGEEGKKIWEEMSDDEKNNATTYDLIVIDKTLQSYYVQMLNFFFEEQVIFYDDTFVFLDNDINVKSNIIPESIKGIMNKDNFNQTMYVIQQTCGIADKKEEDISDLKFKNEKARKLYEKMLKAEQEKKENEEKKANKDLSLPNIISAVATKHPSLNLINIWDLTVFQLLDSFNRLQVNAMYDIDSARVSAWGDEKKTFDATLWYKNHND